MSQTCVDEVFGRALTSHKFRARLLANGREALDGYDLTDDERRRVLAWTAGTFDDVTRDLESRIDRARFDGIGFEMTADHDESPQPLPKIDPAVLDRFVASVLPELVPPLPRQHARSHDRDSERHRNAWLDEAAALGAALEQHISPAPPIAGSSGLAGDNPFAVDANGLPAREACLRDAGIVRQVAEFSVPCGDMRLHGCSVLYGGPYAEGRYVLPKVCGARGLTPGEARTLALSEAAERFAGAVYDEGALVLDCHRSLAADAVSPAAFALYSAAQYGEPGFPYVRFTDGTLVNWTWGYSLLSRRRVLIPAAFVYRPYWPGGQEARLADLPTTGLACGRSMAEATLHGLYEAIEREAIVITWLNRLAVPRVDADGSRWIASAGASTAGATLSIHDITTDLEIPVRLAMVMDRAAGTVGVGAAARLDSRDATDKAAAEALMLESIVRGGRSRRRQPSPGVVDDVRTMEDHMTFYSDPDRMRELDFLLHAPAHATADASPRFEGGALDELVVVLRSLQRRSLDAIVVDLTLPEIASAGLRVVRALVPGLIPLTFGQRFVAKGGARLYDVPVSVGHRATAIREDELNPAPHPFA